MISTVKRTIECGVKNSPPNLPSAAAKFDSKSSQMSPKMSPDIDENSPPIQSAGGFFLAGARFLGALFLAAVFLAGDLRFVAAPPLAMTASRRMASSS